VACILNLTPGQGGGACHHSSHSSHPSTLTYKPYLASVLTARPLQAAAALQAVSCRCCRYHGADSTVHLCPHFVACGGRLRGLGSSLLLCFRQDYNHFRTFRHAHSTITNIDHLHCLCSRQCGTDANKHLCKWDWYTPFTKRNADEFAPHETLLSLRSRPWRCRPLLVSLFVNL
jgi:hypothetical protein